VQARDLRRRRVVLERELHREELQEIACSSSPIEINTRSGPPRAVGPG
jgi:collagenase-like PrtC family protease